MVEGPPASSCGPRARVSTLVVWLAVMALRGSDSGFCFRNPSQGLCPGTAGRMHTGLPPTLPACATMLLLARPLKDSSPGRLPIAPSPKLPACEQGARCCIAGPSGAPAGGYVPTCVSGHPPAPARVTRTPTDMPCAKSERKPDPARPRPWTILDLPRKELHVAKASPGSRIQV